MGAFKKTIVLLLLTAIALAGGCGRRHSDDYEYNRVPTKKIIVEHRNVDYFGQIAEQNYWNQRRMDEEHQRSLEFWDKRKKGMRETMSKFGRNLNEINRMRRRNSGGSWGDWDR